MAAPAQIQSLYEEKNGREQIVHIINKQLTKTDLSQHHYRLLLPISSESTIRLNLLSLAQQAAANILPYTEIDTLINEGILIPEDMRKATALEGVRVAVFVFSPGEPRREGEGRLKKWNQGSIVINGPKALEAWSHLHMGDEVELWGFKDGHNNIYVAIRRS